MSIWAFIDCENVPDLQNLDVEKYDRILLFCGPRNKKLQIDSLQDSGFHHLEILRVPTQGKNNLDFHLAFHLGCLHREVKNNVAFHIISKDQGYDGLIQHLNILKRSCKRIEPKIKLSQDAERIRKMLELCPETSRPGSQAKLESWIANKFINRKTPPVPANLIKRLQQAQYLKLKEGKIDYTFGA